MVKKTRTVEEVQKAYDALPPEIRKVIDGPELITLIPTIGAKHQLHVDQMGVLEGEITDVLIGFEEAKNFTQNIIAGLGINQAKSEAITQDVNELLFLKIRDAMKQVTPKSPVVIGGNEKSVVMPSATSVTAPVAPTAAPKPVIPAPAVKPTEAHAELMLREATVSMPPKIVTPAPTAPAPASSPVNPAQGSPAPAMPKVEAPKPVAPYKTDPYREPPE